MDEQVSNLIELVQQYPQLWNKKDPAFKDKISVENAWKSIAAVLKNPVENCQQAWYTVRLRFTKERRIIKDLPSGSAQYESKWPYYQLCSFLESATQMRRSKGNILKVKETTPSPVPPPPSPAVAEEEQWQDMTLSTDGSLIAFSPVETVFSPETAYSQEPEILASTSSMQSLGEGEIHTPISKKQKSRKRKAEDTPLESLVQSCSKLGQDLSDVIGQSFKEKTEEYYFAMSICKHLEKINNKKKKMQLKTKIMAILAEYESDG